MKLNLIEFLFRTAAQRVSGLSPGSMALTTAEKGDSDGKACNVPIDILKGEDSARLCPTEPGLIVGVVETPECSLLLFGVRLDKQTLGFPTDFSTTMPMHTAGQRSLLRTLANAEECMYVALRGDLPTLALEVRIRPSLHNLFARAWDSVAVLPLNPQADLAKANAMATALMQNVAKDALRRFFPSGASVLPPGDQAPPSFLPP